MAFMSALGLRAFERRAPFEIGSRHRVQLHRKRRVLQARKRVGQVINRIVRRGQGTVPAGVEHRQFEIGVLFLAGLHIYVHGLAIHGRHAARIRVQCELGVDQVAMVLQQPIDAVRFAALLIRGQRQNQVPVGTVALATEADEGGHQNGVVHLHVLRPAPVEITVLLHELEWVGGPILTPRLYHVEVTDDQHRLAWRRCPAGAPPCCPCDRSDPAPGHPRPEIRRPSIASPWLPPPAWCCPPNRSY